MTQPQPSAEVRHLAAMLHDMRQDWGEPGILKALMTDPRPIAVVREIALEAAYDFTARSPAVIHSREARPAPAERARSAPQPPQWGAALPSPGDAVARAGAAKCRAAVAEGRRFHAEHHELTRAYVADVRDQLCQLQPSWDPDEVMQVLMRLAQSRPFPANSLRSRTISMLTGEEPPQTPWGLLAAGNPPASAGNPPANAAGPRAQADDRQPEPALPSADQAIDEPW